MRGDRAARDAAALGVPGEELSKVAYSLLDASSYQGRAILVVGGGDSAVETALGLAEQPGNRVTLSYRKEAFFRIRQRNEERLQAALAENKLEVLFQSEVRAIHADAVELELFGPAGSRRTAIPNDEVFVMAGGAPPFEMLERAGVSFDPALRAPAAEIVEQGTGSGAGAGGGLRAGALRPGLGPVARRLLRPARRAAAEPPEVHLAAAGDGRGPVVRHRRHGC